MLRLTVPLALLAPLMSLAGACNRSTSLDTGEVDDSGDEDTAGREPDLSQSHARQRNQESIPTAAEWGCQSHLYAHYDREEGTFTMGGELCSWTGVKCTCIYVRETTIDMGPYTAVWYTP